MWLILLAPFALLLPIGGAAAMLLDNILPFSRLGAKSCNLSSWFCRIT
jgi:hypothetical protein